MTNCAGPCRADSSLATDFTIVAESHGAIADCLSGKVVRLVADCTSLGVEDDVEEILMLAPLAKEVADLLIFRPDPEVDACVLPARSRNEVEDCVRAAGCTGMLVDGLSSSLLALSTVPMLAGIAARFGGFADEDLELPEFGSLFDDENCCNKD